MYNYYQMVSVCSSPAKTKNEEKVRNGLARILCRKGSEFPFLVTKLSPYYDR
jgi:hypothetical protein